MRKIDILNYILIADNILFSMIGSFEKEKTRSIQMMKNYYKTSKISENYWIKISGASFW